MAGTNRRKQETDKKKDTDSPSNAGRKPKDGNKRHRRTDEELIRDLQERIAELKNRKAAKQLKQSAAMKKTLTIASGLSKAIALAVEEGDTALQRSLTEGHRAIATHLESCGVKLPKERMPRGRKPKA
jgi:hypothetical protein